MAAQLPPAGAVYDRGYRPYEGERGDRGASRAALVREMAAVSDKIIVASDPRREQLVQIARDYHDATVRIIRMWLQEDSGNRPYSPGGNGKHAEMN